MEWYYVEAGERQGPVSEDEFNAMISSGKITPETLVWFDGMKEWQPCKDMAPASQTPANVSLQSDAQCCECGQTFPRLDMIQYEHSWVCGACKPVFFQRILEGAPVSGQMRYAGFWIRFFAKFIDGILLSAVNMIISIPITAFTMAGAASQQSPNEAMMLLPQVILGVIQMAIAISYSVFFVGRYGATPGKMAMHIKILRADGSSLTYGRAFGRYFAEMLSAIIFYIGYIMVAFDEEKRALHDRICDTRVIKTK